MCEENWNGAAISHDLESRCEFAQDMLRNCNRSDDSTVMSSRNMAMQRCHHEAVSKSHGCVPEVAHVLFVNNSYMPQQPLKSNTLADTGLRG